MINGLPPPARLLMNQAIKLDSINNRMVIAA
jgi:hypothetical protein